LSVKPVAAPSVATNVTVTSTKAPVVAVTPRDLIAESKANATWTGKGLYNRR
jgi:hypothetical protein